MSGVLVLVRVSMATFAVCFFSVFIGVVLRTLGPFSVGQRGAICGMEVLREIIAVVIVIVPVLSLNQGKEVVPKAIGLSEEVSGNLRLGHLRFMVDWIGIEEIFWVVFDPGRRRVRTSRKKPQTSTSRLRRPQLWNQNLEKFLGSLLHLF